MDFASRLRRLQVQSASTIAVESLKYLSRFAKRKGFGKSFNGECRKLLEARPTAVVLFNVLQKLKKSPSNETIRKLIGELESAKSLAASNSFKLFRKRSTVLTHCHSSFVVAALVKNKSRIKEVIVTETRPRDQGIITAKELLKNNIKVSYIIDSAISDFIGRADVVLVGADALRKEGLVNKVGTHPLALVAKESRKPFFVVTSPFTFDKRKRFVMEQRPIGEVMHRHLKGAKIFNPAFDITPWKYVTGVVTEKGIRRRIG
ncbi:MAG: hypothetical protein HY517_00810 [Candidatus Aenigmarchaeota archaeon]|nr:hypothetical protein [Candidatus Aenigmarchaeota archaeon]